MKTLVAKPLEASRITLGKVRGDKLPMRKFMRKFTVKENHVGQEVIEILRYRHPVIFI